MGLGDRRAADRGVMIGDVVLFCIGESGSDEEETLRPLVVHALRPMAGEVLPLVDGTLLLSGDDDRRGFWVTRVAKMLPTDFQSTYYLRGIRAGSGVGEWRQKRG